MKAEDKLGAVSAGQTNPSGQRQPEMPDGGSQVIVRDQGPRYDDFPDFDQATLDRIERKYAEAEDCWVQRVAEGRVYEDTLTPDDLRERALRIRRGVADNAEAGMREAKGGGQYSCAAGEIPCCCLTVAR